MDPHVTNWTPGLIALAVAIFAAVVYALRARSSAAAPVAKPTEDLDERYRAILGQLKEHAAQKHLAPAEQWQAEQTRLELAAAAVLRERDGAKHEQLKAEARAEKV